MQLLINQEKEIINTITKSKKNLIYVAWASASGKSYFAHELANALKKKKYKVLEISSDDYYSDQTSLQFLLYGTFDHPNLIEYDLLQKNIDEYFKTWKTKIPIYSFKESRRIGYKPVAEKYDYIIVEGLYTIEKLNKKNNPFTIFVDSDKEELIFRRIIRDQERFKDTIESIISSISKVFPMRVLFGEPQKEKSELIIQNNYEILEKEWKKTTYTLLQKKPAKKDKPATKLYIDDFIYNDENNKNGIIYVSEVYEKKWWLLKYTTITKSKNTKKEEYERIIVPLYKAWSLTMIHSLLQNGWLKLVGKEHKEEHIYEDKKWQKTHYKKSKNKRYLIKQS